MFTRPPVQSKDRVLRYCDTSIGDSNHILEEWARKVINSSPQPRHEIVVDRLIEDMAEKERVGLTFNRSVTESMADRWRALEALNLRFLQDIVSMEEQITDEMTKSQKQIESFVANRTQVIMLKSKYEQMAGLAMHICFYKTVLEAKMRSLENSFHFLQKCAELIGFNQPAQIIDRYGALKGIFEEIFAEFDQRANVLNVMQEKYNTMVDQTIKQNMIKHNEMSEMYHKLKDIKSENTEIERHIQSKLEMSSTAAVTMFKIKNSIFQIYARAVEYRGGEAQEADTSTIDQLSEIEQRIRVTENVVMNVHNAIMHESVVKKKRASTQKRKLSKFLKRDSNTEGSSTSVKKDESDEQQNSSTNLRSTLSHLLRDTELVAENAELADNIEHSNQASGRQSAEINKDELTTRQTIVPKYQSSTDDEAKESIEPPMRRMSTGGRASVYAEQHLRNQLRKYSKDNLNKDNSPAEDKSAKRRSRPSLKKKIDPVDDKLDQMPEPIIEAKHLETNDDSNQNRLWENMIAGQRLFQRIIHTDPKRKLSSNSSNTAKGKRTANTKAGTNYRNQSNMFTENIPDQRKSSSSYMGFNKDGDQSEQDRSSLPQIKNIKSQYNFPYSGNHNSNKISDRKSLGEKRVEHFLRLQSRNKGCSLDTIVESPVEHSFIQDNSNSSHINDSMKHEFSTDTELQSYKRNSTTNNVDDQDIDIPRSPRTLDETHLIRQSSFSDFESLKSHQNEVNPTRACPSDVALMAGLDFYLDTMKKIFKKESKDLSHSSSKQRTKSKNAARTKHEQRIVNSSDNISRLVKHKTQSKIPLLKRYAISSVDHNLGESEKQRAKIINKQHSTNMKRISLQLEVATNGKAKQKIPIRVKTSHYEDSLPDRGIQSTSTSSFHTRKRPDIQISHRWQKDHSKLEKRASFPDHAQVENRQTTQTSDKIHQRYSLPDLSSSRTLREPALTKADISTAENIVEKVTSLEQPTTTNTSGIATKRTPTWAQQNIRKDKEIGRTPAKLVFPTTPINKSSKKKSASIKSKPERVPLPHFWSRKPRCAEGRRALGEMCAARRHLRENCLSMLANVDLRSKVAVHGGEEEE